MNYLNHRTLVAGLIIGVVVTAVAIGLYFGKLSGKLTGKADVAGFNYSSGRSSGTAGGSSQPTTNFSLGLTGYRGSAPSVQVGQVVVKLKYTQSSGKVCNGKPASESTIFDKIDLDSPTDASVDSIVSTGESPTTSGAFTEVDITRQEVPDTSPNQPGNPVPPVPRKVVEVTIKSYGRTVNVPSPDSFNVSSTSTTGESGNDEFTSGGDTITSSGSYYNVSGFTVNPRDKGTTNTFKEGKC